MKTSKRCTPHQKWSHCETNDYISLSKKQCFFSHVWTEHIIFTYEDIMFSGKSSYKTFIWPVMVHWLAIILSPGLFLISTILLFLFISSVFWCYCTFWHCARTCVKNIQQAQKGNTKKTSRADSRWPHCSGTWKVIFWFFFKKGIGIW